MKKELLQKLYDNPDAILEMDYDLMLLFFIELFKANELALLTLLMFKGLEKYGDKLTHDMLTHENAPINGPLEKVPDIKLSDCILITQEEFAKLDEPEAVGRTMTRDDKSYYSIWRSNGIYVKLKKVAK